MGPNQFFSNDQKDRAQFLLATLTGNVGRVGGQCGELCGQRPRRPLRRVPAVDRREPLRPRARSREAGASEVYWRAESAHYYNHDDHPLRVGNRVFTGKTHINCPTRTLWFANANSILGNVKWHYHLVTNVLPKIEMVAVNDWWWSTSCEWADVVFGVDSWAELKHPDMTASVTNPFLTMFPRTPLPRIHDTIGDIEVLAKVGHALAELTGDARFDDCWKFVREGRTDVYIQRILYHSSNTRGYDAVSMEEKARQGVPTIMMSRTHPKSVGCEQIAESKPWWTRTGRLEFFREEEEFRMHGEALPVHREPVDSTFYEPNAILSAHHLAVTPDGPEVFGIARDDMSCEPRQVRNVVYNWRKLLGTEHPLKKDGYRFVFHTPKYRHGAHTMPVDTDQIAHLFGPFGDVYRRDRREAFAGEGYVKGAEVAGFDERPAAPVPRHRGG